MLIALSRVAPKGHQPRSRLGDEEVPAGVEVHAEEAVADPAARVRSLRIRTRGEQAPVVRSQPPTPHPLAYDL